MSWREFSLRSFGYNRSELNSWRKVREVAYYSMIGSHLNPKHLPKSIDGFMPLDVKQKPKVSEAQKQAFLEAAKKYYQKKNEQQS